jgi:hypothetical protein
MDSNQTKPMLCGLILSVSYYENAIKNTFNKSQTPFVEKKRAHDYFMLSGPLYKKRNQKSLKPRQSLVDTIF